MAWTDLATRVANTDSNAAADINALMEDARLIKGGTAGTAPTESLEALITRVNAVPTWSYSAPSGDTTLTVSSGRKIILNPSASFILTLPTTSITTSDVFEFINISYKVITVKSSDGDILQYMHRNSHGIFSPTQATPTDTLHWGQYVKHMEKQYIGTSAGTSYTNGTITISLNNAGISVKRFTIVPYLTDDNSWRAKISAVIEQTADASGTSPIITISGLTFKNITGWYQVGSSAHGIGGGADYGQPRNVCYASPNTGTITVVVSVINVVDFAFEIDAELDSKPTWAD